MKKRTKPNKSLKFQKFDVNFKVEHIDSIGQGVSKLEDKITFIQKQKRKLIIMKKKSINFVIFSEKIDEKKIIIDELCKNLIFIDENIIKVKFNNKNKKLLLYLNNKISKKNKI